MKRTAAQIRAQAAETALQVFDADFFKALCEPARLQLLAVLVRRGRSDVGEIAGEVTQDRSVVSRHLQQMERVGVVRATREGRHVFYEIDGNTIADKLERIVAEIRAIAPLCCPGPAK